MAIPWTEGKYTVHCTFIWSVEKKTKPADYFFKIIYDMEKDDID